jgi:serine/threonine protein phosphatase 1
MMSARDDERVTVAVVPDDLTVFAFSDAHGEISQLREALEAAAVVDAAGRWAAAPRTAIIGVGDFIDRGEDSAGVVEYVRGLADEATAVGDGSRVVTTIGNHEQLLLCAMRGDRDSLDTWLYNGGEATLRSFGVSLRGDPAGALSALEERAPWLRSWLEGLPDAARWRDVLFVHGGLVPDVGIDDWDHEKWGHLWIRGPWADISRGMGMDDPRYAEYRSAGIRRVVYGHTPAEEITIIHGREAVGIDTAAVFGGTLTVIRVPVAGPFSPDDIATRGM